MRQLDNYRQNSQINDQNMAGSNIIGGASNREENIPNQGLISPS